MVYLFYSNRYNYFVVEILRTSAARCAIQSLKAASGPKHRDEVWVHVGKWEILKHGKGSREY